MNKIAKDVPATALNMYSHITKHMYATVKEQETDEPFLRDLFNYIRDGDFELAYRMKFALSPEQWELVPLLVREFLSTFMLTKNNDSHLNDFLAD